MIDKNRNKHKKLRIREKLNETEEREQVNKLRDDAHESRRFKELQKSEYTRINKTYSEGCCALCERDGVYVMPVKIPICVKCKCRYIPDEYVISRSNPQFHGFCMYCGRYSPIKFRVNIADVEMYVCLKCNLRYSKNCYVLEDQGYHGLDPRWRKIRKKYGKDYMKILEIDLTEDERAKVKRLFMGK